MQVVKKKAGLILAFFSTSAFFCFMRLGNSFGFINCVYQFAATENLFYIYGYDEGERERIYI
ncbi:hypothetical protein KFK09_006370 [Dendrobium nobile]|uniref:Uncharacterized protein n=1 Tax=Dendrobium nobile TaxID=94219 RepID=A0A8T3BTK0_DENNO|nr:hypothetical protein KFK09_006370 [Dendrobium nobile]